MKLEKARDMAPYVALQTAASTTVALILAHYFFTNPELVGIWLPILSSSFMIGSTIADYKSTKLSLRMGASEASPTLPDSPSDAQLLSKSRLIPETILLVLGTTLPPVGIGLATGRTATAIHNVLVAGRMKRNNKSL